MVTGVKNSLIADNTAIFTLAFVKKMFFSFQHVVNIIFQIGKKKKNSIDSG